MRSGLYIRLLACMIVLMARTAVSLGQDPLFSQFWFAPQYLNPGLTGTGKNEFRANFNSRIQWFNLQSPFQAYNITADYYFSGPKMSLGFMGNSFHEGFLKTSQAYLLFAKNFGSDEYQCRDWFANFAFQGGFGNTTANRKRLLFPDQIDVDGPSGLPSQFELFQQSGKFYFDMSAGMVFCYYNVMVGGAVHHINEPVNGLISTGDESRLPRRMTFHLSYINSRADYDVADDRILVKPTAIFSMQGVSRSLTLGSLFEFPGWTIGGGIWYRNNFGLVDNHSIHIGIQLKLGSVKNHYNGEAVTRSNMGFTYEAELNHPGVRYTKGSMEAGILYEKNLDGSNECRSVDCNVRYPWTYF